MPEGKKNVGTAPGGTTFVRLGRLPRHPLQQPSQRCTMSGSRTASAPPGVRTEHLNPRSKTDKAPAQRSARRRATYKKRPAAARIGLRGTRCAIGGEKEVSVCGAAAKTTAERKNSRDGCRAERGESRPAGNQQPSGNQRPEAAAAGACPVAGAAGAAGVSSAAVASCAAAGSFVFAGSSAAVGASKRGTPSI